MTDRVENVYSNIDPLTGSVAASASTSDRVMQTRAEYSKMASSSGYLSHTVGSMEWRPPGGGWKKKVAHLGKWEFILKIAEIVLLAICAGLYTEEIHKIRNTSGTMIFPIVIYTSFLIITSCLTICYVAKRGMTDLFAVIYQSLAVLMLFASGGVVMSVYLGLGSKVRAFFYWEAIGIIIQTVFSFLAALVYLADLALSLNSLNAVDRR